MSGAIATIESAGTSVSRRGALTESGCRTGRAWTSDSLPLRLSKTPRWASTLLMKEWRGHLRSASTQPEARDRRWAGSSKPNSV